MTNPLGLAAAVARLVEASGGTYAIGGSLASSLLGEPRSTVDIDLAIHITPEDGVGLIEALAAGPYYVPSETALKALRTAGSFNVLHEDSVYKIDIFVLGDNPLDRGQIERRILLELPGDPELRLWVTSGEDQILRKLDWYRRGGEVSDRQWRDVIGLIELGPDLDFDYLRSMAEDTELSELLKRAIAEADLE